MLAALWKWFLSLFTKQKIGILFLLLFESGVSAVGKEIADNRLHEKAFEFVKELDARKDISTLAKAQLFNKQMIAYGKQLGMTLCESVINCLRELAVNALKAQRGR